MQERMLSEASLGNDALGDLIGNKVEVWSNTGDDDRADEGILEAYDYPFLRLRKGKDEILCFTIYNIRLVKLVKRLKPPTPGDILLRPSGPPE